MQQIKRRGVVLDRCVPCERLWFDRDELKRFLGRVPNFPEMGPNLKTKQKQLTACPRCDNAMTPIQPNHILVCAQDGMLLTRSALELLTGAQKQAITKEVFSARLDPNAAQVRERRIDIATQVGVHSVEAASEVLLHGDGVTETVAEGIAIGIANTSELAEGAVEVGSSILESVFSAIADAF